MPCACEGEGSSPTTNGGIRTAKKLFGWGEADFDLFVRFVGSRLPFPLSNGIGSGLREDGVAALNVDRSNGPIRSHNRIHFDDSCQGHGAGQYWIWGGRVVHDFTPSGGVLLATQR